MFQNRGVITGFYQKKRRNSFRFYSQVYEDIVPHSITSREKDPEELRAKITREGEAPDSLFHSINDLAGVRIIAYFPSDVDKITPLIEKEFKV